MLLAWARRSWSPLSRNCSASAGFKMRATRWVPPAPGKSPILIGLFPGAGGTQRVARILKPAEALQFLLKGDQIRLAQAKSMKLVDAVAPAADLIKGARGWIKAGGAAKAAWDIEGFRLPGGPVYSKAGM